MDVVVSGRKSDVGRPSDDELMEMDIFVVSQSEVWRMGSRISVCMKNYNLIARWYIQNATI